jgi:predicted O-linked N-acetylglucosamine transferase (SPINDLY family)
VLAPKSFEVLHHSGLVALQQGRLTEALDWLGRAHRLDRNAFACEARLALALMAAGRPAEAEAHLRHVVAVKPDFHTGWDNLAACLKGQDRLDEAVVCHEKAVALKPDYATGWFNFGTTLSLLGRYTEALRCHDRVLAAEPESALGHFGRGQVLQQMNRPAEAVQAYDRLLELAPEHHEGRSYRLFALHYLEGIDRERMLLEHQAFGRAVGAGSTPVLTNSRDPSRRLRLAILSPDLRQHSCAYFLAPLLRHLRKEEFELYLYHDHFREDAMSERLKQAAAVWRNFRGRPGWEIERTIRADAPDVLIDLAGHTGMTNRLPLFAHRLAPVQVTYLGYPDTTGLPAMDYRFTDDIADPEGEADRYATERLVRFAPCAWAYEPPADAPPVRSEARASGAPFVFGSFNNLAKITDRQLTVWRRILEGVPGSRLLLKGRGLSELEIRSVHVQRFEAAGLPMDRLDLTERTPDTVSHLSVYHRVDVALDTFPYHGTTTTCEALWMGVPVVTLAGDQHMSRVGASLLTAAGHPEWIARDEADYVRFATNLANTAPRSPAECNALRYTLQHSPLLDHAGQAARFGAALRECWARWCARPAVAA